MADRERIGERGRRQEEEHFRKREQERLEALQRIESEARARRGLAEALGTDDRTVLDTLRDFGLTSETVTRLFVVPLVQMAWVDGSVSGRERQLVLELAEARGVEAGSVMHEQLAAMLAERPQDAFFERSLGAVRALARSITPAQAAEALRTLLADCQAIARASGGLLGIRAITAEEQSLLRQLEDGILGDLRGGAPAA